jgi:LPS sulfotransferase NodH
MNPFESFLHSKSVKLPDTPLDLSDAFETSGVSRAYIVAMTGRSGSTWLTTALSQLGAFGAPREYFNEAALPHFWNFDREQDFSQMFRGLITKYSTHGCFGFKINPQRLFWLSNVVDLNATFSTKTFAWIDMRRWNLVKQGLSFAVAKKSGIWHSFENKQPIVPASDDRLVLTDSDLWTEILSVLEQEQALEQFFEENGIRPLRIFYEEILDSGEALIARVCNFISFDRDLALPKVTGGTVKLDKAQYLDREIEFTKKYADILNDIYSNRQRIQVAEIKKRIFLPAP